MPIGWLVLGDPSHRQVIVRGVSLRLFLGKCTTITTQKPSHCDSMGAGRDKLVLALLPGRPKTTRARIRSVPSGAAAGDPEHIADTQRGRLQGTGDRREYD